MIEFQTKLVYPNLVCLHLQNRRIYEPSSVMNELYEMLNPAFLIKRKIFKERKKLNYGDEKHG